MHHGLHSLCSYNILFGSIHDVDVALSINAIATPKSFSINYAAMLQVFAQSEVQQNMTQHAF